MISMTVWLLLSLYPQQPSNFGYDNLAYETQTACIAAIKRKDVSPNVKYTCVDVEVRKWID